MNTEQQRIAIAKACGWTVRPDMSMYCNDRYGCMNGTVPDYFTNLNAMHEAEASIPYDKLPEYVCRLAAITTASSASMCHIWEMSTRIAVIRATAAQRAEAFGLTLNLWK